MENMKKYLLECGLRPRSDFAKVVGIKTPATLDSLLLKAQAYIQYKEKRWPTVPGNPGTGRVSEPQRMMNPRYPIEEEKNKGKTSPWILETTRDQLVVFKTIPLSTLHASVSLPTMPTHNLKPPGSNFSEK